MSHKLLIDYSYKQSHNYVGVDFAPQIQTNTGGELRAKR